MGNWQLAEANSLLRETLGPRLAVGGLRLAQLGDQRIVHFEIDPSVATGVWHKLCDCFPRSGFWPFSVHGPDLDNLEEKQFELQYKSIIEQAIEFPVEEWLSKRKNQLRREYDFDASVEIETDEMQLDPLPFPGVPMLEADGKARMLLLAVNEPWEVSAFVPVVDPLNNPQIDSPIIHTALWRYWYCRWGAVPCFASYDSVLMKPGAKPANWVELISLAWEHFSYCDDMLYEDLFSNQIRSTWTIADLANFIRRSDFWSFWWD